MTAPGVLQDLRARHDAFIALAKHAGLRVIKYTAPCCGSELETTAPKRDGETWDTLTDCPACGAQVLKVVTRTKVVIHLEAE